MPRKRDVAVVPQPQMLLQVRQATPNLPPHERQPSQIVVGTLKVFGSSLGPLYNLWEQLQVSHCGQYSVERMLALEEYGQRVSPIRVAAVCILTPLSPLVLVLLTACLPLRPAVDGSDANYMFWLRHTIVVFLTILSGMMQAKAWISELPLTMRTIIAITLLSAVITSGSDMLLANVWVFPVPFMNMLQSPVIIVASFGIARLVLGRGVLRGVADIDFRLRRYFMLIAAQGSLVTIYPAFQALLVAVPRTAQPYLMALLTLVNIAMKNVLAACGAHLEDRLPEVIVFSVDVFNSLYSALCMRSAKSLKMVAIVVTLNVVDMMLALHGMDRRSRVALANRALQQKRSKSQRQQKKQHSQTPTTDEENSEDTPEDSMGTLFQATLRLLQLPGQLDPAELRQICLLSCAEHNVSEANKDLLTALAARCVYNNDRRPTALRSLAQRRSRFSSNAMIGPEISADQFILAKRRHSQLIERVRAAVKMIPEAGRRISMQIGTRLSTLGFRLDSRERLSQPKDMDGDGESDTDSFENDVSPSGVPELVGSPSRRDSHQTGPSTPPQVNSYTRRMSGQADTPRRISGQIDPLSRRVSGQGGSARRISTQSPRVLLQTGSSSQIVLQSSLPRAASRRISTRAGSSRRVSAQIEPTGDQTPEQKGSGRKLANHLESTRRLAELAEVATRLETTLKLRPLLLAGNPVINDVLKESRKQNTVAVNQTLQLLFNNEYLGLIAYAQCITPMIYMVYLVVMQELPNRIYYLDGSDLENPSQITQRFSVIAAFVACQTGMLLVLHVFVATRFGVSTLYQVAFVLETHARLVQSKIVIWLLFAVGFMLEHYGVDFSFRFEWIEGAVPHKRPSF